MLKSKKKTRQLQKEAINKEVEKKKILPPRPGNTYKSNMDNVTFEAFYKEGEGKDEAGNYKPTHLREVEKYIVLDVGPLVKSNENYKEIKIGANIKPSASVRVEILEEDEEGYIGSIKPHNIIAVIK